MTLLPTLPQCRDHSRVSPCQATLGASQGWCACLAFLFVHLGVMCRTPRLASSGLCCVYFLVP